MARIRTVKPEFFKHYDLFKAEKETKLPLRLAFQGLWLCADKEGRFKFNHTHLKLDILPYDDVNFKVILAALEAYGFILKYEVRGKKYGLIPTLKDHQRFSGTEAKAVSALPEPPPNLKSGISMEELREQYGSAMELPWNDNDQSLDFEDDEQKELPSDFQGNSEEHRKGKERNKEREGKEEGSPAQQNRSSMEVPLGYIGEVIYDIEKYLLDHQLAFEAAMSIKPGVTTEKGKEILKKYHLWMKREEKYPKHPAALIAGFQSWILNEKNNVNGTHQQQPNRSNPKTAGASKLLGMLKDDLRARGNQDIGGQI
jgi:hypothetical protein